LNPCNFQAVWMNNMSCNGFPDNIDQVKAIMIKQSTITDSANTKQKLILNTTDANLPKEKWRAIPDFEGLYEISNFGRVRSLSRWVHSETRSSTYRIGRIIKLRITPNLKVKNRTANDIDIQMKLHKDGIRYLFSVARYVYHLFVAPFNLNDHRFIITRKDKNKWNCHFKNLRIESISDLAKEGFSTKKRRSIFHEQIKEVSQYSLDGKYLKTYGSAGEAAKASKIHPRYISDAARTKFRPAGDFYWRYGNPNRTINVTRFKARLEHSQRIKSRPVLQLTLNGSVLRKFDSLKEAAKSVGLSSATNISYVCNGKLKSSKGYKWKYL
jgi:NUMOD4 motif/NUMOD1 domain